jgi:release factor glutamine methyltransferase
MQIQHALLQARELGVDRLDAQLLLAHLLQRPRAWLLAHDDHPLSAELGAQWHGKLARRAAGEPLAYVLGEVAFCGLMLHVNPAVLVPRPETELLVQWALEVLPQPSTGPIQRVLDLGTGSGAIALALQTARPHAQVWASDASTDALVVAQRNAARHQLKVQFFCGDWWAPFESTPLVEHRFDLAVANPPYVAGNDPHLRALHHEPRGALTPEGDGLASLKTIVAGAPAHLRDGAWVLLEHGHDQAPAVRALLSQAGFARPQTRPDLAGLPRCTGACWLPPR